MSRAPRPISVSAPKIDAFHEARSRCIDAFVVLEEVLIEVLAKANLPFEGSPLGQKLERVQSLRPSPKFSRERVTRIISAAEQCAMLLPVRNDLVHSRMRVIEIDNQAYACVINVGQRGVGGSLEAKLLPLDALRDLSREIEARARELLVCLLPNPAS